MANYDDFPTYSNRSFFQYFVRFKQSASTLYFSSFFRSFVSIYLGPSLTTTVFLSRQSLPKNSVHTHIRVQQKEARRVSVPTHNHLVNAIRIGRLFDTEAKKIYEEEEGAVLDRSGEKEDGEKIIHRATAIEVHGKIANCTETFQFHLLLLLLYRVPRKV